MIRETESNTHSTTQYFSMWQWLLSIAILIYTSESCSFALATGEEYLTEIQPLADKDYILLTIEEYGVKTYCKLMNVNDGSVSNVVSCESSNHAMGEWSSGDFGGDPTSTTVKSITDNNDGTVSITILRNSKPITINPVTSSISGSTSIGSYLFVDNEINSVFVILFDSSADVFWGVTSETVQVIFPSQTDNAFSSMRTGLTISGSYLPFGDGNPILTFPNSKSFKVEFLFFPSCSIRLFKFAFGCDYFVLLNCDIGANN